VPWLILLQEESEVDVRHPLIVVALILATCSGAVTSEQQSRLPRPEAPYVPTPQPVVDAMLALAAVTPQDVVYDLGSGDGRIPITAAEKFGARAVGVEIDPFMISQAEGHLARSHANGRVVFLNQDLFETDLTGATVITLFLFPSMNLRLIPKLMRELQPGSRVVSHHFDMGPGWPPDESREVNGLMIYLWRIR
jgi:SAM-dependent methyltransferase